MPFDQDVPEAYRQNRVLAWIAEQGCTIRNIPRSTKAQYKEVDVVNREGARIIRIAVYADMPGKPGDVYAYFFYHYDGDSINKICRFYTDEQALAKMQENRPCFQARLVLKMLYTLHERLHRLERHQDFINSQKFSTGSLASRPSPRSAPGRSRGP